MDDFKIIYKILRCLQKSLDLDEPDFSSISAEALGLTLPKWSRMMKIMHDNGYIDNLLIISVNNAPYPVVRLQGSTMITLKGLEYLEENSLMKKAADIAKGVIGIVK